MEDKDNKDIEKQDYYSRSSRMFIDGICGFLVSFGIGLFCIYLIDWKKNPITIGAVVIIQICLLAAAAVIHKKWKRKYLALGLVGPTGFAATLAILALLLVGACSMLFRGY